MAVFAVRFEHPDAAGWQARLGPHIRWLQDRLRDGSLLASGPLPGTAAAGGSDSAMLIVEAADRAAVEAMIATDPFAIQGLIANLRIDAWDPIFGAFNARSSRPGQLQPD